ncbi:hypothetical protein IMY05_C4645000400 [Salix suchowensis]|nr:hypothetical protein IMY05_C4645000400 [Salix suchowensis]
MEFLLSSVVLVRLKSSWSNTQDAEPLVSWCLLLCTALLAYAAPVNIDAIDKTTYDNLVKYAKFAAPRTRRTASQETAGTGVDNGPALRFDINGTQGYLVIDDKAKEIILSSRVLSPQGYLNWFDHMSRTARQGKYRSSTHLLCRYSFWRTTLKTASYSDSKAAVHTGFQKAWLAIEKAIMDTAARFVKEKKGYKWTIVGQWPKLRLKPRNTPMSSSRSIHTVWSFLFIVDASEVLRAGAPRAGNDVWVKDLEKSLVPTTSTEVRSCALRNFVLTDATTLLGVHLKGVHLYYNHGTWILTALFQILFQPCWDIG